MQKGVLSCLHKYHGVAWVRLVLFFLFFSCRRDLFSGWDGFTSSPFFSLRVVVAQSPQLFRVIFYISRLEFRLATIISSLH